MNKHEAQNKRMKEWFRDRTGLNTEMLNIHMRKIDEMLANRAETLVIKPNEGYVLAGELTKKNVTHYETALYIGEKEDQTIIVIPHDLDDFVKVGTQLKITIEEI